jgi:hypothetical protein
VTLCGSIRTLLYSNWNLTDDLEKDKIRFADVGWYETSYAKPQIVVTQGNEPVQHVFGDSLQTYPRFYVNLWLQIPRGANGTAETQQIEDMRYEVNRIINVNRTGISNLTLIPLDVGVPRHEWNQTPRILRFEITILGAQTK